MRPVKLGRLSFLFLLLVSPLPLRANTATMAAGPINEETVRFLRNGEDSNMVMTTIDGQEFLGIDQMAKLAGAQLRWQAVTQQACLSNVKGFLCFNWDRMQIQKDGIPIRNKIPLRFENNQLFVPMKYVLSKDFQNFCESDLAWDPNTKQFSQVAPMNLGMPLVERLSDRYQLRLATPEKAPYSLIEKSQRRIWIRFVRAHSAGSQILEGDSVIREIRILQRKHSSDLLVTLGDDAVSNDIYFDEGKKNLYIDVFTSKQIAKYEAYPEAEESTSNGEKQTSVPVRPMAVAEAPKPMAPVISRGRTPRSSSDDRALRTIVIDAGHGGMDAGAIGVRGTMEKDINLEVARALAKQLKREKNIQVIMTRESDEFVPLNSRTDIANAASADLFVSIHCNSSLSSKGNGFEAYFLSPDATDKAAESVARLENSVVSLEAKKGAASSRLSQLLASMAVYDHLNESSRFAAILCRQIKDKTTLDKVAVKEADFYVLRGAQMPAVLIELEYLSNPVSEIKLRSSRFRTNVIKGISDGILTFDKQSRLEKEAVAAQVERTVSKTER